VLTAKPAEDKRIKDLQREELARYGRPVFVLGVARKGHPIAVGPEFKIKRHDVLTVRGVRAHVEELAKHVGYADRATSKSDMAFMGAGIVIGGLVGAVTVHIAGIR
jgi:putative transport protein